MPAEATSRERPGSRTKGLIKGLGLRAGENRPTVNDIQTTNLRLVANMFKNTNPIIHIHQTDRTRGAINT
jgi:hypothetical protein